MKKVIIYGGMRKGGGISKFILDVYSEVDEVDFEFVMDRFPNDNATYMNEKKMKFQLITPIKKNYLKYRSDWKRYLKANKDVSCIHFHKDSLKTIYPIKIAKKLGIPVILHAHSSKINGNIIDRIAHRLGYFLLNYTPYKNEKSLSCSENASKLFYSNKRKIELIHNGIETSKYKFDNIVYQSKRKELNISPDAKVYIHVGRFEEVKNHEFLLSVFKGISEKEKKSLLILVGEGALFEEIKEKSLKMSINNILFLGLRTDVAELMIASDVMLFPSKFEGFPFSLVEAQTSGLKIIASNKISDEVKLTKNIYLLSIDNGPNEWIETATSLELGYNRFNDYTSVLNQGFDLKETTTKILEIYDEF